MKTKTIILGLILISAISFARKENDFSNFSNSANPSFVSEEITFVEGISNLNNFTFELRSNYEIEEIISVEKWMIDINNENWDRNVKEEVFQVEYWMNTPSSWVSKK